MTTCRLAATTHLVVVMAVLAAVVMSLTVALPCPPGTSDAGIAANIDRVQKNLKFSVNALSMITRPSCEVVLQLERPCRLWDDVTTILQLAGKNSTDDAAIPIRNSICEQMSQTTEFNFIGNRSCSESVVEYLCSRHRSQRESHSLFGKIEAPLPRDEYEEWAVQTFNASITDIII